MDLAIHHTVRSGEIVIEIDNEHIHVVENTVADPRDPFDASKYKKVREETIAGNRNQHFPPYDSRKNKTNTIRSRQVLQRYGERIRFSMDPSLNGIDFIPGERIHVDIEKRIGRITDGCFDPENEELLHKLSRASSKMERSMPFTLLPSDHIEVELKTDRELWNWIYHMRMICNGDPEHNSGPERNRGCALSGPRLCRPVQNVDLLPSFEECCRSLKVVLPLGFVGNAEDVREFNEEFKKNDPDFSGRLNTRTGEITLTPYLAGIKREEEVAV
jgi:hypothetical protein